MYQYMIFKISLYEVLKLVTSRRNSKEKVSTTSLMEREEKLLFNGYRVVLRDEKDLKTCCTTMYRICNITELYN